MDPDELYFREVICEPPEMIMPDLADMLGEAHLLSNEILINRNDKFFYASRHILQKVRRLSSCLLLLEQ